MLVATVLNRITSIVSLLGLSIRLAITLNVHIKTAPTHQTDRLVERVTKSTSLLISLSGTSNTFISLKIIPNLTSCAEERIHYFRTLTIGVNEIYLSRLGCTTRLIQIQNITFFTLQT